MEPTKHSSKPLEGEKSTNKKPRLNPKRKFASQRRKSRKNSLKKALAAMKCKRELLSKASADRPSVSNIPSTSSDIPSRAGSASTKKLKGAQSITKMEKVI